MKNLGLDSWRLVSIDPIGRANENSELLLDGKKLKELLDFIKSKIRSIVCNYLMVAPDF